MQATHRLWNDREREYRWIRLDGTLRTAEDGRTLLYGVYTDISRQKQLETELTSTNEKMEDIINAIPGGVEIYKVSDILKPSISRTGCLSFPDIPWRNIGNLSRGMRA